MGASLSKASADMRYGSLGRTGSYPMKLIAEYLEHAINFERMAAAEKNPQLKAAFEKQAAAYRKLAEDRTKKRGLDDPRY